jgi:Na+-transporting NADH:ubiquinone oxidoreductase subunit NqrD
MSTQLLVTLTVVEIVALVAVLALFVIVITQRLRSIANALGQVSGVIVRAIQGDVCLVGAGAAILNRKLNAIAGALPGIATKAESLSSQKAQAARR